MQTWYIKQVTSLAKKKKSPLFFSSKDFFYSIFFFPGIPYICTYMIHHASCMHAAKKKLEIRAMSNPCQIPFSPHFGTGLRRRKEKKRKKDIDWNVFWSMHTYIHIHACTHTLLPQLPTPPPPTPPPPSSTQQTRMNTYITHHTPTPTYYYCTPSHIHRHHTWLHHSTPDIHMCILSVSEGAAA